MIKKSKYVIIPLVLVLFLGAFSSRNMDQYLEIAKNIEIFTRVYKEISFNYVDEINVSEFLRAGIRGMLNSLDPYTVFIDEKRQDEIELLTTGKYGGIGVSIGLRENKITILEIMDGYSAQKQGLQIGDVIYKVGEKVLVPDDYENISSYVKGEPGTFVKLRIIRDGHSDTLYFELLREEIIIKNIAYSGFYPAGSNNAYIKLSGFSRSAGDELKKVILELQREKPIESVVFDLRGNPGGLLDAAVEISNTFLKKGLLVVSTRGRDSNSTKQYVATQEPLLADVPVVVLVNEGSASASEIVAGAIQDHDRGLILGEKTFGKGLVQTIAPLSYNTSLKITTSKYYTPSGRCIQKVDYSAKNKVISVPDSLKTEKFTTDNKRIVYSAGGITPDSMVVKNKKPEIVLDLLAKGMFFKFATQFAGKNGNSENANGSFDQDKAYSEFKKFLEQTNYKYESDFYRKLDLLMKDPDITEYQKTASAKLTALKDEISSVDKLIIEHNEKSIKEELRIELSSRLRNSKSKLTEALSGDNQFLTAVDLLRNKVSFNKLLSK